MADKNYWIQEVAAILRAHKYYNAPRFAIPNFVIRFLALFDSEMALVEKYLDMEKYYDCSPTKSLLGWQPMPYDQSLLDAASSIIDHENASKKSV